MKRIGIDCRMWNEAGIGRYVRNTVSELAQLDGENEYILFYYDDRFLNASFPKNFRKVKAPIRWHTFAEQLLLPFIYLRSNLDLLYVPHFNVPVLYPKKFVCTIHDLTIFHVKTGRATTLPYPIYWIKRLAFRLNVYSSVLRSKHIFTVSNYVKTEILGTFKLFGLKESKLSLTFNSVDEKFKKIPQTQYESVLNKYKITLPFIFYVGNAHPHKNLERLIQAFALLEKSDPRITLVLGGGTDFFYKRLQNECLSKRVNFIGFIDDVDLPALYSAASCFVNPSLYEGFGIQILEAFACGAKVACSNTTSLPEVSGGKAFYFNPQDVKEIADTISTCISATTPDYDSILKKYSWQDSARVIYSVLKKQI